MTSELIAQAEALPCPHCGESPVVHDIEPHGHPLSGLPEFKGSSCVECGCGAGMIADDRATVLARWNLRAQAEQPASEWQHLKPYGYAPGNYMCKCHGCKEIAYDIDKRAFRCRPCAEKAFTEAEQPAEPAALEVHLGDMHESNGRVTWVVSLCRAGDSVFDGYQIYADAIKGRAEYEAAALKHLLGQGPKPDLLAFDTDPPVEQPAEPKSLRDMTEEDFMQTQWPNRAFRPVEVVEQPAEPQGEPVAFAIRSKRDGSLFATDIAIVGWATFDSRMAVLRAHPWVETGIAEIVPLYARPDPRIAQLEAALKIARDAIEHAERWVTHRNDKQFFQSAKERIEAALGEG